MGAEDQEEQEKQGEDGGLPAEWLPPHQVLKPRQDRQEGLVSYSLILHNNYAVINTVLSAPVAFEL